VADLGGTGEGQRADPERYPVLRAAYLVGVSGDIGAGLQPMLGDDPLAAARSQLRTYYLGEPRDEVARFVELASRAVLGESPHES